MLTFFRRHERDQVNTAIDEVLRGESSPSTGVDQPLAELLTDIRQLALTSPIRPGFVEGLEEDLQRHMQVLPEASERTDAGSPWRRPHLPIPIPLRVAVAALLLIVLGGGITFWLSPDARAQVARLSCFVPGLGIRACEAPGLVMASPTSVSRDGATLTVKSLLSSGDETVVSLEITGLQGPLGEQVFREIHISLQDTAASVIPPAPRPYSISGPAGNRSGAPPAPLVIGEETFGPLNPSARAVDVLVSGPEPIGSWQVRVPLQPVARAGLTQAQPGASSVTAQGITVNVVSVARLPDRTVVQLTATAGPPFRFVADLGGQGMAAELAIRDDKGREYRQQRVPGRTSPDAGGTHTEDLTFEPLKPDAHSAELTLPFVKVTQPTAAASFVVPLAGKQLGGAIPLDARLRLGPYELGVTQAQIVHQLGQQDQQNWLRMTLDLGNWQSGRRLVRPGNVRVNGQGAQMQGQFDASDIGQWSNISVPLPYPLPDEVMISFDSPEVAVQGPWRLDVVGK